MSTSKLSRNTLKLNRKYNILTNYYIRSKPFFTTHTKDWNKNAHNSLKIQKHAIYETMEERHTQLIQNLGTSCTDYEHIKT